MAELVCPDSPNPKRDEQGVPMEIDYFESV
jgi:hypothetical protein